MQNGLNEREMAYLQEVLTGRPEALLILDQLVKNVEELEKIGIVFKLKAVRYNINFSKKEGK